jgi:hypothetical protein
MRIHVYVRGKSSVRAATDQHLKDFASGLRRHGLEPRILNRHNPEPCDVSVTWGVKNAAAAQSGRRHLVLERGYVGNRFHWTSVGWDGLNGRADFCNAHCSDDRWRKHFAGVMKPWRAKPDGYVLIMGQVPHDASLRGLDIERWYRDAVCKLSRTGIPVRFRTHPQALRIAAVAHLELSGTLEAAIEGASWVVTYNSNSAIDAILHGVPAVACDVGSMAWPVTGRKVDEAPMRPDRRQWAANLAYAQWSPDELRNGEAWDHIKEGALHTDALRENRAS